LLRWHPLGDPIAPPKCLAEALKDLLHLAFSQGDESEELCVGDPRPSSDSPEERNQIRLGQSDATVKEQAAPGTEGQLGVGGGLH